MGLANYFCEANVALGSGRRVPQEGRRRQGQCKEIIQMALNPGDPQEVRWICLQAHQIYVMPLLRNEIDYWTLTGRIYIELRPCKAYQVNLAEPDPWNIARAGELVVGWYSLSMTVVAGMAEMMVVTGKGCCTMPYETFKSRTHVNTTPLLGCSYRLRSRL